VIRGESPATYAEASELLRACSKDHSQVRFVGARTKAGWGNPVEADVEVSTKNMTGILEHNAGDLTAVAQAGTRLADLQARLGDAGQMLSIDPPAPDATVGGVIATGDSGPLRHRYGAMRDLVLGMTVVLSDGTIARSGGKVIKNVAGYDLAKLFAGAFGTLGMIVEVALRLHPRSPRSITLRAASDDPAQLFRTATTLAHLPLEMDRLDVSWNDGSGEVLARFAGAAPEGRAEAAQRALDDLGAAVSLVEDDDELWASQREAQRSERGAIVRVSALPTQLPGVLSNARRCVGRAGLGVFYVHLAEDDLVGAIDGARHSLAPAPVVVLDAPRDVRSKVDVWGSGDDGTIELMRRIKARFDPSGICNPGIFVGGI
jgi:glycolate oxidase FAD binding subunit